MKYKIIMQHYFNARLTALLSLILFLAVAAAQAQTMHITGSAADNEGAAVKLFRFTAYSTERLDSTVVSDGAFALDVAVDEVGPVVLRVGENSCNLVLEPGRIGVNVYGNGTYTLSGGDFNARLLGYLNRPDYKASKSRFLALTNGGDTQSVMGTDNEWEAVQEFLANEDIRMQYLDSVFRADPDPTTKAIAAIMTELQPDAEYSWKVISALSGQLGEEGGLMSRIRAIYEQQHRMISRRQASMLGDRYTDFTASTLSGEDVRLSPIVERGKYTLLQFWASWCGPCRKEIPELRELYRRYHNHGLEIVSFSLDKSRNSWEKASDVEQIEWHNLSDLKAFDSEVAKAYPVMGIPANVIIDRSGQIVAVNLLGGELEDKIHSLFE